MQRSARVDHKAAQHARTAVRNSASFCRSRKLSNWPAKLESERSSARADERTTPRAPESVTAPHAASRSPVSSGATERSINPSFISSAQRRACGRSSAANTSRAVASSPNAVSCMRYACASTQKPAGTGRPACPSAARFAALGPKREGSAASGALRGTTSRGMALAPGIDDDPQDAAGIALVFLEGRRRIGERILGGDESADVDRARSDELDARIHVLGRERARADDADLAEIEGESAEA